MFVVCQLTHVSRLDPEIRPLAAGQCFMAAAGVATGTFGAGLPEAIIRGKSGRPSLGPQRRVDLLMNLARCPRSFSSRVDLLLEVGEEFFGKDYEGGKAEMLKSEFTK